MNLKKETIPVVIYACFVLHNYCELQRCPLDEDLVKEQIRLNRESDELHPNLPDPLFTFDNEDGVKCRNIVTRYIKDNLPDHLTLHYDYEV